MNIRFLGAVKGVTGSCHLVEFNGKKVLLDCGMYQGKDESLNFQDFEVNPKEIDYLLLSHSHIDHSGRIPLLVKKGFEGIIYCTRPTYDLCQIMLIDSAHIQETEAEWKNRKSKRSGKRLVEPMYTQKDAAESLKYFKPVLYDQIVNVDENLVVKFRDAGHILGSAVVEMWFKDEEETIKLVFSGDLGMDEKPLLRDPTIIDSADYLIIEATYGNRVHENIESRAEELIKIILETTDRGGTVVIPSFAVGRTQEIIYELNKYYDDKCKICGTENQLKKIPVYIDSPLASKATEIFKRNTSVFDEEVKETILSGDDPLEFENLHFTQSVEESKALNFSYEPKIIISASGMCEAGRIKHHLKHNLWRKESSIVFVGYQAEGTLGRRILDGEKDVKILGEEIHINAEIHNVEGFSGHADKPSLIKWLKGFKDKPKKIFIVHGEQESKDDFADEVRKTLGVECIVPEYDNVYRLKRNSSERIGINEIIKEASEKRYTNDVADKKQIEELEKDVKELRELFERALKLTEVHLSQDVLKVDSLNKINNNIIEIENEILNLSMLANSKK